MSPGSTKLLLVEDNPGDAGLVRVALEEAAGTGWEFELLRVERLSEALEALKERTFDLVLLDLSLPDAHGVDTVVRMRNAAPMLPIVIMTGLDDQALAIEAMRKGAQDYLVKGQVDSAWLARAVRYAIERKRTETQINRQLERQTVLNEINQAITSTLDLQAVMDILLDKIGQVFPRLATMVRLFDSEKKNLKGLAFRNLDQSNWENTASPPSTSLSSAVIEAKTPLLIRDVQNDPRARRPGFLRQNSFISYLGLPLIVKEETVGVLAFFAREADAFPKEDIDFLSTLAGQAAIAIQNSSLYERLKTANEREAVLRDINKALTSTLDLGSILDALLERIVNLSPTYAAFIRLLNSETAMLDAVTCRNLDEADWKSRGVAANRGLAHTVMTAREPVAILDVQNDPRSRDPEFHRRNGLVSFLGLPLIVDDLFLGVLAVYAREPHDFGRAEIEFFRTLAAQASIAIRNSHLYERLKTANETLEKALDVKSVLTGVMAHELKTPIQVIMGAVGLLSSGICGELSQEQRKPISTIERGADELLELIDRTLQMARLEQGKIPLTLSEIAVTDLLAELRSDFEAVFRAKGVELEVGVPSAGPVMKTDRVKVKEILRNLLENARKFTAQGKVTVGFTEREGGAVQFVVSDTGIGIAKESLPKIFDLFYQVDSAAKEHASAGMGLNIVKRLVAALSGEIEVASEPGKGTSFRVTLPKAISEKE